MVKYANFKKLNKSTYHIFDILRWVFYVGVLTYTSSIHKTMPVCPHACKTNQIVILAVTRFFLIIFFK